MTSKIPTISVEKLNYHLLRRICSEHLDQDVCTIQEYIALSFGRQNLESVLLFLWYQVKKLQILLHSLDKRYFKKVFSLLYKLHVRASTIDNMVMFDMEKKENLLVDGVCVTCLPNTDVGIVVFQEGYVDRISLQKGFS